MMLKQFINHTNKTISLIIFCGIVLFYSTTVWSLESDKNADFVLEGDNFKNLPGAVNGVSKINMS